MGRTKRDTPIDTTRTPEFLDIDPSNEPSKAVANEINTPTADVPPEVLTQGKRSLLDPCAGAVVEREDLPEATETKVRSHREQRRPIRKVAMYEHNGPLIRLARRAATRAFDPERKERGRCANAKSLLCDRAPGRSFGHPIVLNHRDPPHSERTSAVPPNVLALSCRPAGRTARSARFNAKLYHGSIGRRCGRSAAVPC
jgi:hypothetical protein